MKRSETLSIGEAFRAFMAEDPDFHEQLLEAKARQLLPQLFGQMWQYIGEHSIKDGLLYLQIYSPAVKQGIMLDKTKFISRINQELGAELLYDLVLR